MTSQLMKTPSRQQKADAATLAAQEIIELDQALRTTKTERLRALRLAYQAENPEPMKAPRKARSKGSPS